jgi:hypothetical protein
MSYPVGLIHRTERWCWSSCRRRLGLRQRWCAREATSPTTHHQLPLADIVPGPHALGSPRSAPGAGGRR